MSLAVVRSRAPAAGRAPEVTVEVHLANGLPSFSIVGLPDLEVRESRERVRAALQNCGFDFPVRRITVNLAPADLPKESGRFDLPIALGILAASGQIPVAALGEREFAGELSLSGALRPMRGAFAMACGTARRNRQAPAGNGGGTDDTLCENRSGEEAKARCADERARPPELYLPQQSAREAALVPGVLVYGAADLPSLCAHLAGAANGRLHPLADVAIEVPAASAEPDMADIIGQQGARRALEVAAAGGHHMLMVGPPGAGKSMLAARLPALLPPMTDDEALASAALLSASVLGFSPSQWRRRPFARRIIRPVRPRSSADAIHLSRARSRSRTSACCFSTSCPNSIGTCLKRCASRSKPGALRCRGPRNKRSFRPPANSWRP